MPREALYSVAQSCMFAHFSFLQNKDIEARYAKLRKEAKVMKKQAEDELKRLKKVVDDIGLAPGKKSDTKDGASQRKVDNQVKARRRAEKRAKAKAEAYEKERKERIFMTVQAAQAAQREAQEQDTKTQTKQKSSEPKRPPRRRPPSQPEAQRPSAQTKPPAFTRKASRFNTKERPSRYVGRMPAASPTKKERRQSSFGGRRPSWDNSKGPSTHQKSKEKPSWAGEFFDNIKDLDSEDFNISDIHENLRRHTKSRKSKFRPAKVMEEGDDSDDDNDDDGKSEQPEVEEKKARPKGTPLRFQTAQEKGERARKGRLAANRAALGLDGGVPPERQEKSRDRSEKREKEKRGQPKRASGAGVHYSDPLEAELNKFRERAKREEKSRRLDDVAIRTYESMWSGFEALAGKVEEESIRFDNIPWLPVLVLMGPDGKESWRVIGVEEHSSFEDKKAALRAQTMRWHPDKFLSRFGSALFPEDYPRIESRVKECSQRLNGIRARLGRPE